MNEERIEQFRKMAQANPDDDLAHYALGQALIDADRHAEAVNVLRHVIKLNAGYSRAYVLLGEAQRCLKVGGWLAVLEWHKRDMDYGPPIARRIDPETMETRLRNLGYQAPERRELNEDQYVMVTRS